MGLCVRGWERTSPLLPATARHLPLVPGHCYYADYCDWFTLLSAHCRRRLRCPPAVLTTPRPPQPLFCDLYSTVRPFEACPATTSTTWASPALSAAAASLLFRECRRRPTGGTAPPPNSPTLVPPSVASGSALIATDNVSTSMKYVDFLLLGGISAAPRREFHLAGRHERSGQEGCGVRGRPSSSQYITSWHAK